MTIKFNNKPIYYERQGKGDPLVLLHGFLESHTMWNALLPDLSKHYAMLIIDLPGHGKSGDLADIHTMELMAEAVKAVLDKEDVLKATFVGHSMGGYVALAFAELFSNAIENLVLLNSTPAEDSITRKKNRERAVELIKKYPEAFISMGITNLFSPKNAERYKKEIERGKIEANSFSVDGIIANIKGMKIRKKRLEVLKNFQGRKQIIAGKDDPVISIEDLRQISKYTNSELIEVDGGHMSHFEAKDQVLEVLKK